MIGTLQSFARKTIDITMLSIELKLKPFKKKIPCYKKIENKNENKVVY